MASGSMLLLGGSLRSARQKAGVSNILNLVERSRRESMRSEVELRYDFQNRSIEFVTLDSLVAKQVGRAAAFDIVSYGVDHSEGGTGADKDLRSDEIMKKNKRQ